MSERRLSGLPVPGDVSAAQLDDLQTKIHKESLGQTAPDLIFQAVKASATLPFEAGKEIEMAIFNELSGGFQAKALQYQFFAERKVSLPPSTQGDKKIPNIQSVSVIGGGTLGSGIVMSLIDAGIHVVWVETSEAAVEAAMGLIGSSYRASSAYKSGVMTEADILKRYQLISPTADLKKVQHADLVIEAVTEDEQVKKSLFARLDAVCKPTAVLASTSSSLDIDDLAGVTSGERAPYVVGTRE